MAFRDIKDSLRDGLVKDKQARRVDDVLVQSCYEILRGFHEFQPVGDLAKKKWFKEKKDKDTGGSRLKARDEEGWEMKFITPKGKLKIRAIFERGVVTLKGKLKSKKKKDKKKDDKKDDKHDNKDDDGKKAKIHLHLGDYMEKIGDRIFCKDEKTLTKELEVFLFD